MIAAPPIRIRAPAKRLKRRQ